MPANPVLDSLTAKVDFYAIGENRQDRAPAGQFSRIPRQSIGSRLHGEAQSKLRASLGATLGWRRRANKRDAFIHDGLKLFLCRCGERTMLA